MEAEEVKMIDQALLEDAVASVPLACEARDLYRAAVARREANEMGATAVRAVIGAYGADLIREVGVLVRDAANEELSALENVEVGPVLDRPAALALVAWAADELEGRGYAVEFGIGMPGEEARLELSISWDE